MPDGKIEGPGRKLSVVALTEATNSERRKVVNFMVEDKSFIMKSGRPWSDHVVILGVQRGCCMIMVRLDVTP